MKRFVATTMLCATAALGLTACSDDSSPKDKATQAASALCTNLSALKGDTAKLDALDPATATKDQIKDAYEAVQKDWAAVSSDLGDLKGAKKDAVSGAADGLKKAYEGLPGDTTGKDALTAIRPQIQKLNETAAAASTSVAC
ncbi:hypothetical protein ACFXDJ_06625 [Streptomyces sp. NPDC059443]|uniref:hypothetical protein n=1 Tax=unclassified Streptomyces TaxID=2593676 RepID=UPI0036A6F784